MENCSQFCSSPAFPLYFRCAVKKHWELLANFLRKTQSLLRHSFRIKGRSNTQLLASLKPTPKFNKSEWKIVLPKSRQLRLDASLEGHKLRPFLRTSRADPRIRADQITNCACHQKIRGLSTTLSRAWGPRAGHGWQHNSNNSSSTPLLASLRGRLSSARTKTKNWQCPEPSASFAARSQGARFAAVNNTESLFKGTPQMTYSSNNISRLHILWATRTFSERP